MSQIATSETMQAITFAKYGGPDVLSHGTAPVPTPADGQVLIRVKAASVNPLDWHLIRGLPYLVRLQAGVRRPKRQTPGADVAGVIEAVGNGATRFQVGDEVFGEVNGSFAELATTNEKNLAIKPSNISFEQAAAMPVAALTALQGLRDKGHIRAGHKVLINGASGGVGTMAVQIAKALGAEVTAVCSGRNLDLVRSIGADHVVDYTEADFTQLDEKFDIIYDAIGNRSVFECRKIMAPDGVLVAVGADGMGNWIGPLTHFAKVGIASLLGSQQMAVFLAKVDHEDLAAIAGMVEAGDVTPVIDRTYSLAQVPEAVAYLEAGHARGKVVISL